MYAFQFLLLETNSPDAEAAQATLKASGIDCEVVWVKSRADFVTALETNAFELILSDYALPDFDGMAALEVAHNLHPEIPFIFVSASVGEERAIAALEAGAAGFVLKQQLERLVPCVQRVLRKVEEYHNRFERDRANLALRKSEAKYRSLFESIDEGLCICEMLFDENGEPQDYRFLEVNSAFERITGLQQATGKTARELVPNIEAHWVEICGSVVQTGEPIRYENQSIAMNRWFNLNAFPIDEPQSYRFAILVANTTDRKQVEQERERFLALGSDLQVITGRNDYFQWVSPSFEQTLGWTQYEMTSRPWTEFVHPDDINTSVSETASLFAGNKTFRFENRYRHKDGSYRWLLWNAQLDPEEQVIYGAAVDITERKQAEEDLLDSEERFRTLTATIPQLIWTATSNGSVDYLSEQWADYIGLPPERLYDWSWQQVVHPDDLPNTLRDWERSLQSGDLLEIQHRFRYRTGEWRWQLVRGIPIKDGTGQVTKWVGTCTDIQSEVDIKTALQESEKQSRNILESINDGFFALDEDWRFTYVNQAAERLTNRTATELLGKNFWEEFPGVVGTEFEQLHHRAMQDRIAGAVTAFYPDHDRWYIVHSYPAAQGITAYFRDVTAQTQVEAALRESEEKYRTLFESLDEGFCIIEMIFDDDEKPIDYRFLITNPAFERQTGSKNVVGKTVREIAPQHEEYWFERYGRVALTGESIRVEDQAQEFHGWYEVHAFRVGEPQLRRVGVLFSNITERKQAEAEREQLLQREQAAREEAELANRIKEEFLAVLSHELRSPLNPILGWTRLLQSGKPDVTRQREALATIERNAQLQTQLIEDLLDISRIMQGKLSLTAAPVSLTFVITAALETVRLAAQAKHIAITLDLNSVIAPVSGDAARLQQVVWNLLSNAVKFTPNGGRVTVELRQIDQIAQIRVIDTGKGISPSFLPHVFEYFRQADATTTRKFGGLGLGLAIVRQIVEMHGGTVKAESLGENQGATFTVELPVIQQASLAISESPQAKAENTEAPLSNLQILVVDDDEDTREFQAFLLEQSGARVIAVASGLEALQVLDQSTPDVLLSDIGMAHMDGYMLIQQIRSRPPHRGGTIPAIAVTAYTMNFDLQKARQSGFQAHITKPVEPVMLVKAIINQLNRN